MTSTHGASHSSEPSAGHRPEELRPAREALIQICGPAGRWELRTPPQVILVPQRGPVVTRAATAAPSHFVRKDHTWQ